MCTEMFVTHTAPEIVSCIVKISVLMYTEDCTAAELACIFTAAPSECSKELQRDEIGGYQGMILSEQLTTLGPQFAFLLKAIHSCAKLLILQLMHQVLKEP
jgi:hypothetical protein